jgi:hypothetical protein
MATLGVNIDHVATVRQARRTVEPDPVWAAALAELGGADAITVGARRFESADTGVVFTAPDPDRPARAVLVISGRSPTAVQRSHSLPDLLPAYVVFDERVAGARGRVLLGPAASVLAAGFFDDGGRVIGDDRRELGGGFAGQAMREHGRLERNDRAPEGEGVADLIGNQDRPLWHGSAPTRGQSTTESLGRREHRHRSAGELGLVGWIDLGGGQEIA